MKRLFVCASFVLLAGCLMDDDSEGKEPDRLTLTGMLAELDTVPHAEFEDTTGLGPYIVRSLKVTHDSFEFPETDCLISAFMGASAEDTGMAVSLMLITLSEKHVFLLLEPRTASYTHYRLEIDCSP